MDAEALLKELESMLLALKVPYIKGSVSKRLPECFFCDKFGVIAIAVEPEEVEYTTHVLMTKRPNHRYYIMSGISDFTKARFELIWLLAEGGYLYYLRSTYQRQFADLLTMQDFGRRIIEERLARWNNLPKYKYFIDENEKAKKLPYTMILSVEPGFFDHMPEKEGGLVYVT